MAEAVQSQNGRPSTGLALRRGTAILEPRPNCGLPASPDGRSTAWGGPESHRKMEKFPGDQKNHGQTSGLRGEGQKVGAEIGARVWRRR